MDSKKKEGVSKILGIVLLMQLMFMACQMVQVSKAGAVEFQIASAQAQLSSTNLSLGTSNPFTKINDTSNAIYDGLRIAAIGLMMLALGVCGILMFKGRMNPTTFLWILGGAILFGSAPDIAKFILSK